MTGKRNDTNHILFSYREILYYKNSDGQEQPCKNRRLFRWKIYVRS